MVEGLSSQNVSNWWHHHLTHCHHRPFCKYRLQNGVDHSFCSDQRKILGLTLLGDCCQEINLEFGFCHYTGVTTNEIIGAVPMTLERPESTCARLVARIIMKLYALTSASLHKRHSVVASLFDPRPIRQARMDTRAFVRQQGPSSCILIASTTEPTLFVMSQLCDALQNVVHRSVALPFRWYCAAHLLVPLLCQRLYCGDVHLPVVSTTRQLDLASPSRLQRRLEFTGMMSMWASEG